MFNTCHDGKHLTTIKKVLGLKLSFLSLQSVHLGLASFPGSSPAFCHILYKKRGEISGLLGEDEVGGSFSCKSKCCYLNEHGHTHLAKLLEILQCLFRKPEPPKP